MSNSQFAPAPANYGCVGIHRGNSAMPSGAALVDRLANELGRGNTQDLQEILKTAGFPEATLQWGLPAQDYPGRLRDLLRYWDTLKRGSSLPSADSIDPCDFAFLLGFIMLVDPLPACDFRYRLYGTQIATYSGKDRTGTQASEIGGVMGVVTRACYRAVMLRREPLYSRYVLSEQTFHRPWHRLILPLQGGDGAVSRFLVANIPDQLRKTPQFTTRDGVPAG
jgi:hypothetical protein